MEHKKPWVRLQQSIKDRQWYVSIMATNGQVLFASEGYVGRWGGRRAAKKVAKVFGLEIVER